MSRRTAILGLGVVALLATAAPAFADGPQPYPTCANKTVPAADSESAHTKYLVGRQEYDEGIYDRAVKHFREAYALDCTKHDLLLIISSSYQLGGNKREALSALETYVARVPNSPDMATYQTKIENLKAALKQEAEQQQAAAAAASAATTAPPVEQRSHTPYPWIVVGIGGAATAAGIILALVPSVPDSCVNGVCATTKDKDDATKAKNLQTAGWVTFGSGLALVGGGLLWHFLEPTGPKPKAALTPLVAPGFAGMSVGGAF